MRASLVCLLALAVIVAHPSALDAKLKPRKLATVAGSQCDLALDPSGNPHVAYIGADYHLYHARFDGRKWQHQLVDGTSDCGWGNSIAIDAQGHIHLSYHAERMNPYQSRLVYGYFDGTQWQLTDLDTNGYSTSLVLDPEGNPHILFDAGNGTLGYAWYDNGWHIEDTGLPSGPYAPSLALDEDNHVHIAYAVNYSGHFYATREDGVWQATALGGEAGDSALALDSAGSPHIAACDGGTLLYYSLTGTNWASDVVIDSSLVPGISVLPDGVDMAMDAADRPHFLASVYVSAGAGGVETCFYAFDDGIGWSAVPVDIKNAGFYPSLVLGTNGLAFGTYCGALKQSSAQARYIQIALPNLSGTWSNAVYQTANGLTGQLWVTNHGLEKSAPAVVGFALSDDATLSAEDILLPPMLKLKGLKAGAGVSLLVELPPGLLTPGKYLLAVIDAELATSDADLTDNIVPVFLQP